MSTNDPHTPGWFSVIFGVLLSAALGVILGFVQMATKPVEVVKEIPADAPANKHYLVEGSAIPGRAGQVRQKLETLFSTGSGRFTEDEINRIVAASIQAEAFKNSNTEGGPPWSELTYGNVRFHDGRVQLAQKTKVNVLQLFSLETLFQSDGVVTRTGDSLGYETDTLHLGHVPLHRLAFIDKAALQRWMARSMPKDEREPLNKLVRNLKDLRVEGNQLVVEVTPLG